MYAASHLHTFAEKTTFLAKMTEMGEGTVFRRMYPARAYATLDVLV